MGYRSCLGIIRLGKQYSAERLEAAAGRALQINAVSYQSVKSILQNGLDRTHLQHTSVPLLLAEQANVRGRDYYLCCASAAPSRELGKERPA